MSYVHPIKLAIRFRELDKLSYKHSHTRTHTYTFEHTHTRDEKSHYGILIWPLFFILVLRTCTFCISHLIIFGFKHEVTQNKVLMKNNVITQARARTHKHTHTHTHVWDEYEAPKQLKCHLLCHQELVLVVK